MAIASHDPKNLTLNNVLVTETVISYCCYDIGAAIVWHRMVYCLGSK